MHLHAQLVMVLILSSADIFIVRTTGQKNERYNLPISLIGSSASELNNFGNRSREIRFIPPLPESIKNSILDTKSKLVNLQQDTIAFKEENSTPSGHNVQRTLSPSILPLTVDQRPPLLLSPNSTHFSDLSNSNSVKGTSTPPLYTTFSLLTDENLNLNYDISSMINNNISNAADEKEIRKLVGKLIETDETSNSTKIIKFMEIRSVDELNEKNLNQTNVIIVHNRERMYPISMNFNVTTPNSNQFITTKDNKSTIENGYTINQFLIIFKPEKVNLNKLT